MEIFAYIMVMAVGLPSLVCLVRRVVDRPAPTPATQVDDVYEAAFLTAGPGRVAHVVLAGLAAEGRIEIRDPGIVAVREFAPRDRVEAAFLDAFRTASTSSLYWLRVALMRSDAVQAIGEGLAGRGLALRPSDPKPPSRRAPVLSVIGLLLCLWALFVPIVSIVLAVFGPVGLLLVVARPRKRVTPAGRAALAAYRRAYETSSDLRIQIALHGLSRIPDRELFVLLTNSSRPGARYQSAAPPAYTDSGAGLAVAVVWCGGGSGHAACGGSSCGSSGDSGWSTGGGSGCGSSGGSSCGSSSGGSSCGSSSGGSSCGGGGGGSSCGSSS
ncbi:TIGR04222 domain-containing membrane protein [Streptomyces sp. N35]|uniref:TIGR04222 domain-containing membrane protein n=1 Tax=Streptomyces sp. N35 TaxID=2795730 RepID=UPI0018F4DE35|nr:TIGR04222 domain-containing membrane protein [Streptomyces sp. N35]